ncbi:cysteine hydrolase family protein [Lactococcus termiticola]|uniref:nicotinamidase n=1 Tax=Lactococcus termiticola TaxID=2169526 RepID=A0A2R5HHH8_9LACT|nr:isochorismatase family cysteine hydrolase [Lactococcus termiticola]GBG97513.1 isochorismatase [Lactococcus termiticola]
MRKLLALIDFQNDFITGSLGTKEAEAIVPKVIEKWQSYPENARVATQDTHYADYLESQEGQNLPVVHCRRGTEGWELHPGIDEGCRDLYEKSSFGSVELAQFIQDQDIDEVELIGICTDICVVSNALLIKAYDPEVKITVDASCCAGTTPEAHLSALETMKSCQINIINE